MGESFIPTLFKGNTMTESQEIAQILSEDNVKNSGEVRDYLITTYCEHLYNEVLEALCMKDDQCMTQIMLNLLDDSLAAWEEVDNAIANGHYLGECDELISAKNEEWRQLEYTIDNLERILETQAI